MEGITEKSWDKKFYIEVSVFIVIIISIIGTGVWIIISNDLLNLDFNMLYPSNRQNTTVVDINSIRDSSMIN